MATISPAELARMRVAYEVPGPRTRRIAARTIEFIRDHCGASLGAGAEAQEARRARPSQPGRARVTPVAEPRTRR